MITVVGEALIDLVITPDGAVDAKLGGAPFNTARACGRLGADVRFVGALSVDRFGTMLTDQLAGDGVDVAAAPRVEMPTTLAAAELDGSGTASYRFYIDGTSAPALSAAPPGRPGDVIFTGGLSLVLEPMAATVEALVSSSADPMVVVDVNCRPLIVPDRDAYVDRVDRVIAQADVVKVSDEDLAYLRPGIEPLAAARRLLELGPAVVLVTAGGDGAHVVTAAGERSVTVEPVDVVDTIGAGDSFDAGFLTWWFESGLGADGVTDLEQVTAAVRAANTIAGIVVGRRGADPPHRRELPSDWGPPIGSG